MKKLWLPIITIVLFLILTYLVFTQNSTVLGFDKLVESFFAGIHNQFFEKFFTEITKIGDLVPASIFVFVLAFILLISKRYNKTKVLLVSSGLAISVGTLIKELTERARPESAAIDTIGSSFPSNHAIIATVLCLFFIYEFSEYIKIRWQKDIFIVFVVLLFFLLALSRLVLNVHWASDVVAGILFGVACFSISRKLLEKS